MGISIWQLAIILVIVVLIFGTKKLRNMGGDLGGAMKNFKNAVNDDDKNADSENPDLIDSQNLKSEQADADFTGETNKDKERQ